LYQSILEKESKKVNNVSTKQGARGTLHSNYLHITHATIFNAN